MKSILFGIALLCGLASPAFSFAQSPPAGAGPVLRPGDIVQIKVWRKDELSGEFLIAPDGSIGDPFYQELKVAGLPINVVEEQVKALVARYETSPKVLVAPLFRISVAGEVRQPGLFNITAGTTIMDAIALAGGVTERVRMDAVLLYRDGVRQVLDLSGDGRAASVPLRSGDHLVMGRRSDTFSEVIAPSATVLGVLIGVLNLLIN